MRNNLIITFEGEGTIQVMNWIRSNKDLIPKDKYVQFNDKYGRFRYMISYRSEDQFVRAQYNEHKNEGFKIEGMTRVYVDDLWILDIDGDLYLLTD